MPLLRCPRCDTQVEVDERDLGYDVECPSCHYHFEARLPGTISTRRRDEDDEDARPRRRYDDEDDEDDDRPRRRRRRRAYDDEELIDDARRAVFLPGLFTIIICAIGILLAILDLALIIGAPQMMQQQMKQNPIMAQVPVEGFILIRIGAIIWESVILAGASSMMRLRSYKFAKVAMVLRIIPFMGLCCILGAPFGIWGMAALNKPDVQDGFEAARRARERQSQPRVYDEEE